MVQEEQTRWEAMGVRQVCDAEAIDRECLAQAAVGRLHSLHTLVRGKGPVVIDAG